MCEELRRIIHVCYLQGVRWRGQGFETLEMEGRRYMWWSGKKMELVIL